MPLCTYLNENEIDNTSIKDEDVLKSLQELRKVTKEKWVIRESDFSVTRWFRKKVCIRYELLWPVKSIEYQIILCHNGYYMTKDEVLAYIEGYLGCYEWEKRNKIIPLNKALQLAIGYLDLDDAHESHAFEVAKEVLTNEPNQRCSRT